MPLCGALRCAPDTDCVKAGIGFHEMRACSTLWRQLAAEFLGTFLLVVVGCGSTTGAWSEGYEPTTVQISLTFGLVVACLVQCFRRVSGAHVNPAVTAGLLAGGRVPLLRALLYVAVQCAAAVAGAALLQALTPPETASNLGATTVSRWLTPLQAFFVEALITFVLVGTVFSACFASLPETRGSAPFAIGLSVTACHLFAMQYTGASMNPARSLGPAVITGIWENHWVYWGGPALGGVSAGVVYRCLCTQSSHVKEDRQEEEQDEKGEEPVISAEQSVAAAAVAAATGPQYTEEAPLLSAPLETVATDL